MVIAASRRSRQRPSPLRGGHGGGLYPFVVVTAEVFFTPTQKQRKIASHATSVFFVTGTCLGFAPLGGTCAARRTFRRNRRGGKQNKPGKATSTAPLAVGGGHVAVFAAPPWRSRRSFADTAGGFSWRCFLFFNLAVKTP